MVDLYHWSVLYAGLKVINRCVNKKNILATKLHSFGQSSYVIILFQKKTKCNVLQSYITTEPFQVSMRSFCWILRVNTIWKILSQELWNTFVLTISQNLCQQTRGGVFSFCYVNTFTGNKIRFYITYARIYYILSVIFILMHLPVLKFSYQSSNVKMKMLHPLKSKLNTKLSNSRIVSTF